VTNIFTSGGGRKLAQTYGIEFLGAVPIQMEVGLTSDSGVPIVKQLPDSAAAVSYRKAALALVRSLSK